MSRNNLASLEKEGYIQTEGDPRGRNDPYLTLQIENEGSQT